MPELAETLNQQYQNNTKIQKKGVPPRRRLFIELFNALDVDLAEVNTLQENPSNKGDFRIRTRDLYIMYMNLIESLGLQPVFVKAEQGGYMTVEDLEKLREETGEDVEVENP